MREEGAFQVLKRKLSFHPSLAPRDRSSTRLKKMRSFDSFSTVSKSSTFSSVSKSSTFSTASNSSTFSMASKSSSPTSTDSDSSNSSTYQRYPVVRLNDNLSLSIGDSFESVQSHGVEPVMRFEYGPIRFPKQVRLLLLLPSYDPDEPLETILFHADLREVPFQALSLYQGELGKTRTMNCNGRGMHVTESLYSALLSVRNLGDNRAISIVWVDAVCINPADVKERESQLRLVRDIFSAGVVTTVWLGGTEDQQRKVFATVDMLHEACRCDEFRHKLEQDQLDVSSLEHLSIGDKTLQISYEHRQELSRIFSHPWFDRIWAFQEVVASRKTFILYGNGVRPWTYFATAAWCMHKLHWESGSASELSLFGERKQLKYHHLLYVDDHRDGVLDNQTYGLLELLTSSRQFTSSQPLDRIFALYGLMGNTREHEILESFFNYKLSPLTVFLNLTVNMMLYHETLDVLHLVSNDPVARPTWPSFVPDLAGHNTSRQIGSRKGRHSWEYHAAGNSKPSLRIINGRNCSKAKIPHFEDDVHISLNGMIIDEVCRVGIEMKDSGFKVASFLADWVNAALMTGGKKFYTMNELRKAQNVILSPTMKDEVHGDASSYGLPTENGIGEFHTSSRRPSLGNGAGEFPTASRRPSLGHGTGEFPTAVRRPSLGNGTGEFPTGSRRPSLGGIASRRPSVSNETRGHLRNSFAPSLIDALKTMDVDPAADSPTLYQTPLMVHPEHISKSKSTSSLPDTKYPLGNISNTEAFWRTLLRDRDSEGMKPSADTQRTHFEPWFRAANGGVSAMLEALQGGDHAVHEFSDWVHAASCGSKIMRTRNGYIGTGSRYVEEGDLVCILYGGQTPFVLRREAWGNYRFIGDCYLHGIMDGEALNMELDETEFVLV